MILTAFDTETSGFNPGRPAEYRSDTNPLDGTFAQVLSFGWASVDTKTGHIDSGNLYAKFDPRMKWSSHAEEIHGLTREFLEQHGIDESKLFDQFCALSETSDHMIAHNLKFDIAQIYVSFLRSIRKKGVVKQRFVPFSVFKDSVPGICTLEMAKRLPYPAPNNMKLETLHKAFFNEGFSGAHNSQADAVACLKIYLELKKRGVKNAD